MSLLQTLPTSEIQPRMHRAKFICETLRSLMSKGKINPGDKLPTEEELCKHFQVSRTTLREALQMLRFAGLLDVRPGRGSYVQQPTADRLLQDFALFARTQGSMMASSQYTVKTLLEASIERAHTTSLESRRSLFNHVLNRQEETVAHERKEREWLKAIAGLDTAELNPLLVEMMLATQETERLTRFSDSDEVMKTMQTQIRFNTAMVEEEYDVAKRVLNVYLSPYLQARA